MLCIAHLRIKPYYFIVILSLILTISNATSKSEFDELKNIGSEFSGKHNNKGNERSSLIISTIDGKVTALDLNNNGRLLWTTSTGDNALVQSSLTKLLMKENGKVIRLIPSLNGDLFRFDGKTVEAVPYTADQLLSSSFRVGENQLLVGGKDVTTYGLDAESGRVIYLCSSGGCKKTSETDHLSNVLVIKRQQQTVRSVESRHGNENWNFSVGELELDVARGNAGNMLSIESDENKIYEDEFQQKFDHGTNFCNSFYDIQDESFFCNIIKSIKMMVPEGTVCSVNDDKIIWRHQFKSPIAKAWAVIKGHAIKLDLFNPEFVPALKSETSVIDPSVYLGSYKEYFYIQSANHIKEAIKSAALSHNRPHKGVINPYYSLPRFEYHPYLANGNTLKQAVIGEAKNHDVAVDGNPENSGRCENQLAVYLNNPLDKSGFYFVSDSGNQRVASIREHPKKRGTANNDHIETFDIDYLYISASIYWKELLILTIIISGLMQFLIAKCKQVYKEKILEEVPSTSTSGEYVDAVPPSPEVNDQQIAQEYQSRFLMDFEPVRRLGKGGFGVVFEVKNKVDDCSYAVKRITLPKKKKAREKVMREVRALAKLDHHSIVRYFHSWTEEPPIGWQDNKDSLWMDDLSQTWTQSPSQSSPYKEQPLSMLNYYSTSLENAETSSNLLHNYKTQSFVVMDSKREDSGSFIVFDKSKQSEQAIKGKFFESNDTSGTESSDDCNENQNGLSNEASKPFKRYGHSRGDSFSIVFGNDDSAIEMEAGGKANSYKDPFSDYTKSSESFADQTNTGLRKRSASQRNKETIETSSSDLKQVVCKENSKPKRPTSVTTQLRTSPSTVYLYIQMQLCKKESLREWLSSTRDRDTNYCMCVFQQVTSAVEYVHEMNLIHRDLKPSNIFFSHDGTIKVGDFGLVTELDEGQGLMTTSTPCPGSPSGKKSKQGHTEQVGTKMYMAPEQMTSSNYTQKVDIFALGLILIELLDPYGTQMERIRSLMDARRNKFSKTLLKKHPKEVELASCMLSKEASDRPSASDISSHPTLENLENCAGSSNATRRHRTLSSKSSLSNSM